MIPHLSQKCAPVDVKQAFSQRVLTKFTSTVNMQTMHTIMEQEKKSMQQKTN
jgi:hypothetical protein